MQAEHGDAGGSGTQGWLPASRGGREQGGSRDVTGGPLQDTIQQLPPWEQSSVTPLLIKSEFGDAF